MNKYYNSIYKIMGKKCVGQYVSLLIHGVKCHVWRGSPKPFDIHVLLIYFILK